MFKERAPLTFYILAISLLALSSTLAYFFARKGLEDRENDAKVVNLAGRQRMLSQRITKNCLELQRIGTAELNQQALLEELHHAINEWQLAYQQLNGAVPIERFTIQNSEAVRLRFDSIEQPFQMIKNAALQILHASNRDVQPATEVILKYEPAFLSGMDEIVLQYQKESTANIQQLGQLETYIWIFTLVLLLLELFFIFIPLNRRIMRELSEKNARNQLLIEKQNALENSLSLMQRMQQNLLEAEKLAMLGETVGVITHEINTPIGIAVTAASSLNEYTQQLVTAYHTQQLRKSSLEAYVAHVEEGSTLVLRNLEKAAQLLQDFKNVTIPQLSGHKEHFDLSQLITQVANTLSPFFKNTDIQLTLNLPPKLEINNHPGIFAQIIMNLVTNSLKHGFPNTPQSGSITIRLTEHTHHLHLSYQDDGVGIPPALLPQIFEPFFSTAKQKGGSGLGLSIVQHLVVKQLGGIIHCKSDINAGVLFDIQIPKHQKEAESL
jgi:signal transduction histidine kinase